MRIGILGTRGIPNRYGGFEQFAEILSVGLAEKGHELFVYNSSLHPYKEKEFGKVQIIHCKDPENKFGTAGQFIYDRNCLVDARQRNFDVLLHLGYTSDSVWWRRWPKDIIHIVNMDGLEWMRAKYNALTRRFLKYAEKLAAKHADLLIADSLGIQDYLLHKYEKNAVYIPYGAFVFDSPGKEMLKSSNNEPYSYSLLIARMEPENNIEMIIKGWLAAATSYPMLIIGNDKNKYGRLLRKKYEQAQVQFLGPVYDPALLNNLRYYSRLYFHGHSAGGTNPSLLEAMACCCRIAAYDNIFNRAVLGDDAFYFSSVTDIQNIITREDDEKTIKEKQERNLEKIRTVYSWPKIITAYEELMLAAVVSRR